MVLGLGDGAGGGDGVGVEGGGVTRKCSSGMDGPKKTMTGYTGRGTVYYFWRISILGGAFE